MVQVTRERSVPNLFQPLASHSPTPSGHPPSPQTSILRLMYINQMQMSQGSRGALARGHEGDSGLPLAS